LDCLGLLVGLWAYFYYYNYYIYIPYIPLNTINTSKTNLFDGEGCQKKVPLNPSLPTLKYDKAGNER
jgi:hypothetical protein